MSKQNENSTINTGHNAAKRVAMGVVGGALGQLVNIVARLLIVPMFLWAWGESLYGEWLSLEAVVSYLMVLDLGIQTYAVNRLTQLYATGKAEEYTRVLHSALGLYIRIAVVAFIVLSGAAAIAPLPAWLQFSHMDKQTATWLAVALCLRLVVQLPNGAILGAYRSCKEYPKYAFIGVVSWTAIWIATALALFAKCSPPLVAAAQVIPIVATTLYALWDIPKRHAAIRFGFSNYDKALAWSFLAPSMLFFLMQGSLSLVVQGSTMLVASAMGPAAVASFATTRMVPMLLRQAVSQLTSAVWPELTALEAKQEYRVLRKNHVTLVKLSFAVVSTMAVAAHFVGPDLIPRWTLGKVAFDSLVLDLFLAYVATQTIWMASSAFPASFNKHGLLAAFHVANTIIGLPAAWWLGRSHGLAGVVWGLWIGDLLFGTLLVPLITCRLLSANPLKLWAHAVGRGIPLLAVQYAACAATKHVLAASWIATTAGIAIVSALVFVVGGYAVWLSSDEKILAQKAVKRLMRSVSRRIRK